MFPGTREIGLLAVAVVLGACASADAPGLDQSVTPSATNAIVPAAASSSAAVAKGGYQMSAEELELDCKKLAGRMQIRILEIRDFHQRSVGSATARVIQQGATTVFGGTRAGTDPNGTYARDRGMLEAYNRQLVAKGCKSYDLDAELSPKPVTETPRATIKPPTGAAPAAKPTR